MVEFIISKIFVDFDKISCFLILNLGAKWWWRGYSNGRTPKTATRPNWSRRPRSGFFYDIDWFLVLLYVQNDFGHFQIVLDRFKTFWTWIKKQNLVLKVIFGSGIPEAEIFGQKTKVFSLRHSVSAAEFKGWIWPNVKFQIFSKWTVFIDLCTFDVNLENVYPRKRKCTCSFVMKVDSWSD